MSLACSSRTGRLIAHPSRSAMSLACSSRTGQLIAHPSRSTRLPIAAWGASEGLTNLLTFGKLPLGKLHIWEVATWEIITWSRPSENT